ncbi:ROK family protein [candidate division KSB1 bacterium]|nr:ROK family protein [candidate division KSB1 bacterium]
MSEFWGIDFGGTNLRIGRLKDGDNHPDHLKIECREDISGISTNEDLFQLIKKFIPQNARVGISAAGNVNEKDCIIAYSPNSKIKGTITFGSSLKTECGCQVHMTNDLKAAVQAEARYGSGKELENVLVATYSSGFNCAVARNKQNVTSAEFGHLRYKQDGDLFCGCGGLGHIEPYVSGNGAASMAKQFFHMNKHTDHPIILANLEDCDDKKDLNIDEHYAQIVYKIGSKHVYQAFKSHPDQAPQKQIFETQVKAIATSFGIMNSAYNPLDIMVLMGSQTKDAFIFEKAIAKYQEETLQNPSLPKPTIVITQLGDNIGVLGAIAYFQSQEMMTE